MTRSLLLLRSYTHVLTYPCSQFHTVIQNLLRNLYLNNFNYIRYCLCVYLHTKYGHLASLSEATNTENITYQEQEESKTFIITGTMTSSKTVLRHKLVCHVVCSGCSVLQPCLFLFVRGLIQLFTPIIVSLS